MPDGAEIPETPAPPDARERPRVGVDEWVAQVEERRVRHRGLAGLVRRAWDATPPPARLFVFVAFAASLPFFLSTGNLFAYGLFTLLYALLGLGLNTVVGFAGLLDLGYVAFYGFGAYFYALLSSGHYGIHWQAEAAIPVIVVAAAFLGLLLGLPSRRLLGDYLAIVTLFFGQAFVVFVNNANPTVAGVGLTGGPGGIAGVDPLNLFGFELTTYKDYYYFLLAAFVVVIAALYFVSESRTGRAWRALREDPLAAEAMGMPVNRLKLMAFAFGAGIAGFCGCVFAALQTGVFPGNFDVSFLITIYAVVVLGGMGSLTGVVIGAIVINVSFELLSPASGRPDQARLLFYGAIFVVLIAKVRPWSRLATVLAGTVAFGFAIYAIVNAVASSWTTGSVTEIRGTGEQAHGFAAAIQHWVIIPSGHGRFGAYAYVGLIVAVLVLTRLRGWWRTLAFVPTLYLVAIVWENLLAEQPSVTRLILFGALLIALMNARPQGLLGTARVEIM